MKTSTFTVDNLGDPEPIVAQSYAHEIEIYENAQAGNTDYDVFAPDKAAVPVRRPAGAKTLLKSPAGFHPGQIAGYVGAATAGTYTFAQEER